MVDISGGSLLLPMGLTNHDLPLQIIKLFPHHRRKSFTYRYSFTVLSLGEFPLLFLALGLREMYHVWNVGAREAAGLLLSCRSKGVAV